MDVMVVCVHRDKSTGLIKDYVIIDGSFWGITWKDYLGCREYFTLVNNHLDDYDELLLGKYPDNLYLQRKVSGDYEGVIFPKVRKLISWKSPFNK